MGILRIPQSRANVKVAGWHDFCSGPDGEDGVMHVMAEERVRVRGCAGVVRART